ncbi:Putative ribonuclease H protein At1g65750 [Linum perenne]
MRSTGTWNALWKCRVPPRIKVMLWRLARGILPTRSALYRRGIQIEDVCGVCNTMFETQWHLFVDCSFARGCWDRVGLREETNRLRDSTDSFKDWILTAISSLSAQKLQGGNLNGSVESAEKHHDPAAADIFCSDLAVHVDMTLDTAKIEVDPVKADDVERATWIPPT